MNPKIPYYATNQEVPSYLNDTLKPHGYELVRYQIGEEMQGDLFILFSPVWHHEHFISCDKPWKHYLQKEKPDFRLITAGFREATHENYIDLIQLPTDFEVFFSNALPARDAWEPMGTGGLNMQAKLQRFFEGHGTDSVKQLFSKVITTIKIINDELKKGAKLSVVCAEYEGYPNFIESWSIFKNRFSNYYPFLNCLPFYDLFQKINVLIQKTDLFVENNCQQDSLFEDLQVFDSITEMKALLNTAKKYV